MPKSQISGPFPPIKNILFCKKKSLNFYTSKTIEKTLGHLILRTFAILNPTYCTLKVHYSAGMVKERRWAKPSQTDKPSQSDRMQSELLPPQPPSQTLPHHHQVLEQEIKEFSGSNSTLLWLLMLCVSNWEGVCPILRRGAGQPTHIVHRLGSTASHVHMCPCLLWIPISFPYPDALVGVYFISL